MDLIKIIQDYRVVLLVDWPDIKIPLELISSGYRVFSFSPEGYSEALFSPTTDEKVIFQQSLRPDRVDMVIIYRPVEEHADIIKNHVLPLGAKLVWLLPPIHSPETKKMVEEMGLAFVQGHDITEII